MGSYIKYQGKSLGRVDYDEGKWILVMENVESLETLLRLQSSDIISIDEKEEKYEKFRKRILEKTGIIYTSMKNFVDHEFPFRVEEGQ